MENNGVSFNVARLPPAAPPWLKASVEPSDYYNQCNMDDGLDFDDFICDASLFLADNGLHVVAKNGRNGAAKNGCAAAETESVTDHGPIAKNGQMAAKGPNAEIGVNAGAPLLLAELQDDGGDIEYCGFDLETGIVKLTMQRACSGCPSSSVTLNSDIENMLMHYVPEDDSETVATTKELEFTRNILALDAKKYHSGSHRQWVLREVDIIPRLLSSSRS